MGNAERAQRHTRLSYLSRQAKRQMTSEQEVIARDLVEMFVAGGYVPPLRDWLIPYREVQYRHRPLLRSVAVFMLECQNR